VHRAEAREFREDVIRVARGREPGVRIKDIAADFGMSESCPTNWRTQADRDQGVRAGPTGGRLTPVEYEMIMTSQATRAA
jgi:transposase-like protein